MAALDSLNNILGTAYTLSECPLLAPLLQQCITDGWDFGRIFARCRANWSSPDPSEAWQVVDERVERDQRARDSALDSRTNTIVRPALPPRRLWDLGANRVIPTPWWPSPYAAVSHSWMFDSQLQHVVTAINNYEWPVPIPSDTTLDRIRIELLNLGYACVWLDVLCLRQRGDDQYEHLRRDEWLTDVPTIGAVYHPNMPIVHYYSGLGRPFRIEDLDSERHWLNRAWTLQEISQSDVIAGITPDSPLVDRIPHDSETGIIIDPVQRRFYDTLSELVSRSQEVGSVFLILGSMRHRHATNELDKIAGLAYLLKGSTLPPYVVGQDCELAWDALVKAILPRFRGDLIFLFPLPGNGRFRCYPSWSQIKSADQLPRFGDMLAPVVFNEVRGCYRYTGYRFDDCKVVGLDALPASGVQRRGELHIQTNGQLYCLPVFAPHSELIANDSYTVVSAASHEIWLIGRPYGVTTIARRPYARIEKISTVRATPDRAVPFSERFGRHHFVEHHLKECYFV
ncbi:hypothetical protein EXIGLDRAFT_774136 [Exidia glandulosa HHB12029]|uniref:Heterokaryon incompatibility domain-containing protein n=1 Tax=Exidia glandulosa HHB12029 TaxID=1314781 RepID=A0A165EHA8_EXIGL|nr:hypothetical protein EXIGLDRAFT_774136 [Exidia glandulosa HHB12029]